MSTCGREKSAIKRVLDTNNEPITEGLFPARVPDTNSLTLKSNDIQPIRKVK